MTAVERNLASLEQALSLEIQRRIDLESRIASQVEAGLRKAARSATGVVEEQLATAQRQYADEIRVRLLSLERSVGSLQHRLSQVEDRAEKPQGLQGDRQLAWLESRIAGLELQKPLEMPLEVSRQLQLIRSELIDEAAARWQDVAQLIRAEVDDARQRVDALERWLREAMAPEVVRLQLDWAVFGDCDEESAAVQDLASERRCREQLEKKVANPTQRSPRVPPVNKATWSFESMLPRERKSLKAPEQGSQGPVHLVSKEQMSETPQDLDGATAHEKDFPTEQSTALSAASASLELQPRVEENEGDENHVSVTGTAIQRKSESTGPDTGDTGDTGGLQEDGPDETDGPGGSLAARGAKEETEATKAVSDENKTSAASGQASAESAPSAAEAPRTQRAMLGRMRRSLKDR